MWEEEEKRESKSESVENIKKKRKQKLNDIQFATEIQRIQNPHCSIENCGNFNFSYADLHRPWKTVILASFIVNWRESIVAPQTYIFNRFDHPAANST